jgi:thiamine-phosphate diphosphorylase
MTQLVTPVAMAVVTAARSGLLAIDRGATILQLRAPGLSARELEHQTTALVPQSSVPVLISSRCDIALAAGAAGVNLPELDVSVADARRLLGQRLIGRSVHSPAAADEAARDGADFVIFGPVWPSPTHSGQAARGVEALAEVVRAVSIPVLAIGGVTSDRAGECAQAGAAGYAAIRMFQ